MICTNCAKGADTDTEHGCEASETCTCQHRPKDYGKRRPE